MLSGLDLSYNKLSGTITSSVGKIPQFLYKWVSLELLNLTFNDFEGEVPVKKRNSQPSQSSGSERFLKVSYNELLKATDGFSTENLIGEGGFSSVYKGILDSYDDKFVAVKVLHLQNRGAHKSFLAECIAWRNIRHRNLLKIITSCSSVDFQCNDFKALVYEFMPNGKYGIGSEMTSSGDVYSFGILLLELMTGKKPTDDMFNEGLSIHKFASMALPDHVTDVIDDDAIVLQSTEANAKKVEECLVATIKIGGSCSVDSPPQRMKIEIAVIELQRILDVLQNI
ncbi:kinase-like domain-containing protein [Tanacetum coccineum]